jgi:hypothetical protein
LIRGLAGYPDIRTPDSQKLSHPIAALRTGLSNEVIYASTAQKFHGLRKISFAINCLGA